MAQNITLMGASYPSVPAVRLPKTGGGTATFTDVTDTTATSTDVASGKIFYLADGSQAIGTNSGGDDFVVTLTKVNGTWTPDCTYAELMTAYNGGKSIAFKANEPHPTVWGYDDSNDVVFYGVYENSQGQQMYERSNISYEYLWSASGIELDSNYTFWNTDFATASATDVISGKKFYTSTGYAVGSLVVQTYYTGNTAPSSSLGIDGDIYLKVV